MSPAQVPAAKQEPEDRSGPLHKKEKETAPLLRCLTLGVKQKLAEGAGLVDGAPERLSST